MTPITSTQELANALSKPIDSDAELTRITQAIESNTFPLQDGRLPEQPLHLALKHASTYSDSPGLVATLLRNGADPNARNQEGQTGFHYLAAKKDARGTMPFVQTLQDFGGDMRLRDHQDKACWERSTKGPVADDMAMLYQRKASQQAHEQRYNVFDASFPPGAPMPEKKARVAPAVSIPSPAQVQQSVPTAKPGPERDPHRPSRISL